MKVINNNNYYYKEKNKNKSKAVFFFFETRVKQFIKDKIFYGNSN